MERRQNTVSSNHTASSRDSRRSADSYDSRSTVATSFYDSPRPSKGSYSRTSKGRDASYEEDLSPSTSLYPRSSVDTYSSQASSIDIDQVEVDDCVDLAEIPPLPLYRHQIVETNVRPSSPEDFAELFPSMDRLSIRHDDFTSDGNMNLRVDTVVTGRRRSPRTIQLFHLRMHDLARREFSLRRYCRESGREVCNSKRKFTEPATQSRPNLQRSVSSAMKNLGRPSMKRVPTAGSKFSPRSRSSTSASADHEFTETFEQALSLDQRQKTPKVPTNTIKLEFSNYARVDVQRCGSSNAKRYEFEWWGHKYSWRRTTAKLTGVVSFHLCRDGNNTTPVAHIVPETRSPNQVDSDEVAGGWVPPCHMWISDEALITAMTDVADVVVATGLMALVDDCIKERWGTKKAHHIGLPLTSKSVDVEYVGPKAFVQQMFSRRKSDENSSALRQANPVAAY
ncbi:uncharacterized protein BCR38DRAFT_485893 [Pseudomassariella vexata]|uniref:Uncharacterized protein n=1 Tax=Pseudomassariella vexata TaxID=1141098 RepID=A0A1Y2DVG9_9PEZI|nr:uncharacterized protein BCR38DRAFT_485893 [Pseudomassariella vexata]ORY63126.1 hypothetical protein BCR38DRAFT_485893 [Pseudomassariella vexata]